MTGRIDAWARWLGLLTLFLASLAPAAAQGRGSFDPFRDLDGFQEAMLSEYSELFDFARFEARKGESLSAAELTELRAGWQAERVRVLQEIERIETDPAAGRRYRLERQLQRHPYFSKLAFEQVEGHEPFLFAVHQTLGAGAVDPARAAAELAPWLRELEYGVAADFARPLEWRRRADHERFPVIVLASRGAFDDYLRVSWNLQGSNTLAFYEQRLRLLVLQRDSGGTARVSAQHLRDEGLREAARFLLDSYATGNESWIAPLWFGQGFADYLAGNDGREPKSLRTRPLPAETSKQLLELLRQETLRAIYWFPLGELLEFTTWDDVTAVAEARAKAASVTRFSAGSAGTLMRFESAALVHYLMHGENGQRRERFLAAAGAALRGGGKSAFAELFAGEELAQVEAGWIRHIFSEHRRAHPNVKLSDAELANLIGARALAGAPLASSALDAERLPQLLLDDPARLALALARMRRGDAESAALLLAELATLADEPMAARARRELERVEAWIASRDAFLAHVAGTGDKLTLEHRGAKLVAAIEDYKDGELRWGSNRARLSTLRANELDPLELARQMAVRKLGFEPDWSRAYVHMLGGLGNWKRMLGESAPERALLAEQDYDALLALAEPAARLDAIARAGPPLDPRAADALLKELTGLWSGWRAVAFVAALRAPLAEIASTALSVQFDQLGLGALLRGKLENLAGGHVRLSYDFRDAAQLEDFPSVDPASYPAGFGVPPAGVEVRTGWEQGRLYMRGDCVRRHLVAFEGPTRVRFTWSYREDRGDDRRLYFVVGLCARKSGYVGSLNGLQLERYDKSKGDFQRLPEEPERSFFMGSDYEVELIHDGASTVTMKSDGELVAELPCNEFIAGELMFFTRCSATLELDDVVIEGRPSAAGLDSLRRHWIGQRLAELGLTEE